MELLKKKIEINIEVETTQSIESVLELVKKELEKNKDSYNKELAQKDSFTSRVQTKGSFSVSVVPNYKTLDLSKDKHKEFKVLKDINVLDTNYNMPRRKLLKKGSVISIGNGANNGDIFAKDEDGESYVLSNREAIYSRYPYDRGVINLDYFEKV